MSRLCLDTKNLLNPPETPTHGFSSDLRKSGTTDSLTQFVAASPELTRLHNISPLPSPILPHRLSVANIDRRKSSLGTPEELGRSALRVDYGNGKETPLKLPRSPAFHMMDDRRSVSQDVSTAGSPVIYHTAFARKRSLRKKAENEEAELHREPHLARNTTLLNETCTYESRQPPDNEKNVITVNGIFARYTGEEFELPHTGKKRRWKAIRTIGEGTFSRVVLARDLDGKKELVAIKIVELTASGAANRERVEMTVRREIQLLQVSIWQKMFSAEKALEITSPFDCSLIRI